MIGKALSFITAIIISLTCFSSCSSSETDNVSMQTTTCKETPVTTITEETTTASTIAKPAERPVPDKIKKMLEYTEPDYRGQPGGPAAAFMTYYGYRGHEGAMQDEMWFQDMDGDNIPDLVVGGYSVGGIPEMGQGQVHCFEIQNYNSHMGGTVHLRPDYDNKSKHGHNAFVMQAYKDKDGSLIFVHTQFHAASYAPEQDPRFAGTFIMYQYSFNTVSPDTNKKEIMAFTYDPKQSSADDAFTFISPSNGRLNAAQGKALYNSYFAGKTPLKANIKPINYQQYMYSMTQQQRKKALMDSYYSFSYTVDTSIQPYAKTIFDKI